MELPPPEPGVPSVAPAHLLKLVGLGATAPQAPQARTPVPEASQTGETKGGEERRSGHWRDYEHKLFIQGLELHGKKWDKVAEVVGTRSTAQVRSHAQKYYKKPMVSKPRIEVRKRDSGDPWTTYETRSDVVNGCEHLTKQTLGTLLAQGQSYNVRRVDTNVGEATSFEVRKVGGDQWERFSSMETCTKVYTDLTVHHISALLNACWEARYVRDETTDQAVAPPSRSPASVAPAPSSTSSCPVAAPQAPVARLGPAPPELLLAPLAGADDRDDSPRKRPRTTATKTAPAAPA